MQIKKLVLLGVLIVTLLFSSTTGITYALQNTSEDAGVGTVRTASLAADAYWSSDMVHWQPVETDVPVFSSTIWEPSHTQVRYFKIVNDGTLDFHYSLKFVPANSGDKKLAEVIDVYCGAVSGDRFTDFSDLVSKTAYMGTMSALFDQTVMTSSLSAKASGDTSAPADVFAVALHMQESAGNTYQGKNLGNFSLVLYAEQITSDHTDNES